MTDIIRLIVCQAIKERGSLSTCYTVEEDEDEKGSYYAYINKHGAASITDYLFEQIAEAGYQIIKIGANNG